MMRLAPYRMVLFARREFARVALMDVQEGDCFHREGRWWTVDQVYPNVKKGSETRQSKMVFKDLVSGVKKEVRIKSGEKVDTVELETRECEFVEAQPKKGKVVCKVKDTGEDLEVAADQLGYAIEYLKQGSTVLVRSVEETVIKVEPPKHVTIKVTHVPPRADQAAETRRIAVLENGRKIKVPAHVEEGQEVTVRLSDESYVG